MSPDETCTRLQALCYYCGAPIDCGFLGDVWYHESTGERECGLTARPIARPSGDGVRKCSEQYPVCVTLREANK